VGYYIILEFEFKARQQHECTAATRLHRSNTRKGFGYGTTPTWNSS